MEEENIAELRKSIERARAFIEKIMRNRADAVAMLTGGFTMEPDFEYPEPDRVNVYPLMFGHRMTPTSYRLSFGKRLRWIGVSHPWGLKPADIEIPEDEA